MKGVESKVSGDPSETKQIKEKLKLKLLNLFLPPGLIYNLLYLESKVEAVVKCFSMIEFVS